jgi:hypothetical protein
MDIAPSFSATAIVISGFWIWVGISRGHAAPAIAFARLLFAETR